MGAIGQIPASGIERLPILRNRDCSVGRASWDDQTHDPSTCVRSFVINSIHMLRHSLHTQMWNIPTNREVNYFETCSLSVDLSTRIRNRRYNSGR